MEKYGNSIREKCAYCDRTQYGLYQDAVNLSTSADEGKWKKAIFWIFDAPGIGEKKFEVEEKNLLWV
jgi:hypothetical protein